MLGEWHHILNAPNAFVSRDGEVEQDDRVLEPYRGTGGHRVVDLLVETDVYDRVENGWKVEPRRFFVWMLVRDSFLHNWPEYGHPYFLDGDAFNCSVDNLRAIVPDAREPGGRVVHIRREEWGLVFDKRRHGRVEVIESGEIYPGVSEAARAVGGTRTGISSVLAGRKNRHRGFTYRWID